MQPTFTQVPPSVPPLTMATLAPCSRAVIAAAKAADPAPMTSRSYLSGVLVQQSAMVPLSLLCPRGYASMQKKMGPALRAPARTGSARFVRRDRRRGVAERADRLRHPLEGDPHGVVLRPGGAPAGRIIVRGVRPLYPVEPAQRRSRAENAPGAVHPRHLEISARQTRCGCGLGSGSARHSGGRTARGGVRPGPLPGAGGEEREGGEQQAEREEAREYTSHEDLRGQSRRRDQ